MTESLKIPHFYLMEEIDVTDLVYIKNKIVRNERKFKKTNRFINNLYAIFY